MVLSEPWVRMMKGAENNLEDLDGLGLCLFQRVWRVTQEQAKVQARQLGAEQVHKQGHLQQQMQLCVSNGQDPSPCV